MSAFVPEHTDSLESGVYPTNIILFIESTCLLIDSIMNRESRAWGKAMNPASVDDLAAGPSR